VFILGTCYYEKPTDYYLIMERLFQALRLPATNMMESSSALLIRDALVTLNSPALFSLAIKIDMNSVNRLKEVKICYDLQFRFTSCM
jgi:ribonuclease I